MVPVATARTGVEAGSRHRSLATPAMERLGAQWEGGRLRLREPFPHKNIKSRIL